MACIWRTVQTERCHESIASEFRARTLGCPCWAISQEERVAILPMRPGHHDQSALITDRKGSWMQLGMIGLGRMRASMVWRLLTGRHACVVDGVQRSAVAGLVKDDPAAIDSHAEKPAP